MSSSSRPQRPILSLLSPSSLSNPFPFSKCKSLLTPHVRFPTTPNMTSEHSVWSPGTYDRAPILVSPNTLALPDRHDRVLYSPDVEGRPVRRGRSFRRRPKAETEGCYSPMVLTPYPVDSPTQESPLSPPPLDPDSPCSDDEEVTTPRDNTSPDGPRSLRFAPEVRVTSQYDGGEDLARVTAACEPKKKGKLQRRPTGRRRLSPSLLSPSLLSPSLLSPVTPTLTNIHGIPPSHLDEGCLGGF